MLALRNNLFMFLKKGYPFKKRINIMGLIAVVHLYLENVNLPGFRLYLESIKLHLYSLKYLMECFLY